MAAYWNDDNFQWTTTDIYIQMCYTHLTLSLVANYTYSRLLLHNLISFYFLFTCCFAVIILKFFFLFSIWITIFFACNNFIRNFFLFICAESGGKWVGVLCFVYKDYIESIELFVNFNG